jgi:hypothetical protein
MLCVAAHLRHQDSNPVPLQSPWGKSVGHHLLSSYYRSLFAVVSNQLDASVRHDDGLEGLLSLLQDVPMMRVAVKEHAEQQGISLAERLGLGDQGSARHSIDSAGRGARSARSARANALYEAAPASAHEVRSAAASAVDSEARGEQAAPAPVHSSADEHGGATEGASSVKTSYQPAMGERTEFSQQQQTAAQLAV